MGVKSEKRWLALAVQDSLVSCFKILSITEIGTVGVALCPPQFGVSEREMDESIIIVPLRFENLTDATIVRT